MILLLLGMLSTAKAVQSSYPDVNKTYNDDTLKCWAAAAANTLEWTGWGIGSEYDIMQEFKDYYADRSGISYDAWKDYFSRHYSLKDFIYVKSNAFVPALANQWLSQGYGVTFDYSYSGGAHTLTLYRIDVDPHTGVGLRVYYADSDDGIIGIKSKDIFFDGVETYYFDKVGGHPMGQLWGLAPVPEGNNLAPKPTTMLSLVPD